MRKGLLKLAIGLSIFVKRIAPGYVERNIFALAVNSVKGSQPKGLCRGFLTGKAKTKELLRRSIFKPFL